MSKAKEEQLRNSRRLARQMLGAVALVLIVIGLFTVAGWVAAAVRAAFDDSEERRDYEQKLYGLVMFDALPFADAAEVDPAVFQQAAVWSSLYQTQRRDGNLDAYEREEGSGAIILPRLEVETYLKNLLGPEYEVEHGAFETADFYYGYSEEKQGYLVPVTGLAGLYTPTVESIRGRGGQRIVTVGYIPTSYSGTEMLFGVPTEPTKYMEYVFTRGSNRQWYLTALQESDLQPAATAAPGAGDMTGLPADMGGALPGGDYAPEGDAAVPEPAAMEDGGDETGEDTGEDTGDTGDTGDTAPDTEEPQE